MRRTKASNVSSQRSNWEKIFDGLVQMLRTQQNQLRSLVKERSLLEDRVRMQHDGWISDIRLYNDQISEMKGIVIFEEKKRLLETAKADLVMGSTHREASIINYILEHSEDELADFKAWFECLSRKFPDGEDQGKICEDTDKTKKGTSDSENKSIRNVAEEKMCSKKIEGELRRLKQEYKIALEKSSMVSALLAEKKFVWNQYNVMENEFINKLRSKHSEVEQANQKIEILVSSMEQLQSANDEKDDIISRLESKVSYMEADTKRLNEEISRLLVELESLRNSKNIQVTPGLNRCTEGTKSSGTGGSNSSRSRSILKKEISAPNAPDHARGSEKGNRSLKRKEGPVIPVSETAKLFSSNFKVPKLKNSCPTPSVR